MLSLRHNSRFLYLLLLLTISCTSKIALSRLALKLSTFSRKHLLNQKSHGHESLLANRYSHGRYFHDFEDWATYHKKTKTNDREPKFF